MSMGTLLLLKLIAIPSGVAGQNSGRAWVSLERRTAVTRSENTMTRALCESGRRPAISRSSLTGGKEVPSQPSSW